MKWLILAIGAAVGACLLILLFRGVAKRLEMALDAYLKDLWPGANVMSKCGWSVVAGFTLNTGETFTVDFSADNGVLTIA
jgi:hypothetical protein